MWQRKVQWSLHLCWQRYHPLVECKQIPNRRIATETPVMLEELPAIYKNYTLLKKKKSLPECYEVLVEEVLLAIRYHMIVWLEPHGMNWGLRKFKSLDWPDTAVIIMKTNIPSCRYNQDSRTRLGCRNRWPGPLCCPHCCSTASPSASIYVNTLVPCDRSHWS